MKFEFPKIVSLDILYSCLIVIKILIKTKANEPATGNPSHDRAIYMLLNSKREDQPNK